MRIAPALLPHLRRPSAGLWADTALNAMLTHNDRAAIGSCVAFGSLLWELLGREKPPEPGWWTATFCAALQPLEGKKTRYTVRTPQISYTGPLWEFAARHVPAALKRELPAVEACDRWRSGAYLLETVPSVLYLLARHGHEPEEAVVRAVNDTLDNDTIAAIVGAAVGALHGAAALPARWREGLLGRTGADDDGRVGELLAAARGRWWEE